MTFGALYEAWWEKYGSKRRGRRNDDNDKFNRRHLSPLWGLVLTECTSAALEGLLQNLHDDLSPRSINMLRSQVHTVFSKARKLGLWAGENPAAGVDRRRETPKNFQTLRAEEVPVLLQHLDRRWRALFATAIFSGLRKGELLGLQKTAVDLENGTISVQRSYEADTTKGGHTDVIPIAQQLRPFLEQAIAESTCELVFPSPSGAMYPDDVRVQSVLRRALGRAGIVEGYENTCRREGCDFSEEVKEASRRPCPQCGMKLWP